MAWLHKFASVAIKVVRLKRVHIGAGVQENREFTAFINKFQDGIVFVSLDGFVLDCNDAFRDLLGYSKDELKKLTFHDFTPEKFREWEEAIIREKIISKGYSGLYEKEYIRKDGTHIPVEVNAYLTRDSEEKPESMWAFVRDISTRKESENAMRRQLEEVTILQNLTEAGMVAETVDELLYRATKILGDSLYQEHFGVLVYDEKRNYLTRHYSYHDKSVREEIEEIGLSATSGITGRTVRTRIPHRVADTRLDPDFVEGQQGTLSELAVPIIVENKVFGVINAESQTANFFKEEDEKLLITLANQLATSITKIQLRESEMQKAREVAALYETALATSHRMDTELLYQKIYDQVDDLFPLDTFLLVEYDDQDESMRIAFVREEGKSLKEWQDTRFEKSESGLIGWVIQSREPFLSPDLTKEALPVETPSSDKPAKSWLGVPLITQGKVVGGISVQSFEVDKFDENHLRLLESLAAQLATAVDAARLAERNQRHIEQLEALHDIDLAINSSLDLRVTLNILLDQVIEKLVVDAAVVLLFNPQSILLEYAASRGFRTRSIEGYKIRLPGDLSGKSAMERHLAEAFNLVMPGDNPAYTTLMESEGFTSYYSVPLVAKGQVKGVLDIFNRSPLNPDQEWFNFLETLGGQAAIAIDNTSLLEDLHLSNIELRQAYDTTLEGWSRALDLRDRETEGHTQRVVDITVQIAKTLGVPDKEIVHIRRGALLHDIGKMGIPDAILLKPGPLTEDEWEVMHRHPVYAYQLLYPIEHLRPAIDIPYCHHEHWDGDGYPRKLKERRSPLPAAYSRWWMSGTRLPLTAPIGRHGRPKKRSITSKKTAERSLTRRSWIFF